MACDGGRGGACERPRPAPGRAPARRRVHLLSPISVRRRLRHAGGARAEVLGGVLPGRRP
jgi:hypothetical protein